MSYDSQETPADYICSVCSTGGVKLWRETNCFSPALFCVDCNNKRKGTAIEPDEGGRVPLFDDPEWRGDHFNSLVPAVPTEDGTAYWGFTSVPEPGVRWWRALPLRRS